MMDRCIDVGCSATYTPWRYEDATAAALFVLIVGLTLTLGWTNRLLARKSKEREGGAGHG